MFDAILPWGWIGALIQLQTLPLVIFRTSTFTASGKNLALFFNTLGHCLLFLKASCQYPLANNMFWCLNPSQVSTLLRYSSSLYSSDPVNRSAAIIYPLLKLPMNLIDSLHRMDPEPSLDLLLQVLLKLIPQQHVLFCNCTGV